MKNQKLELTWIGKDKHPRLEPRILLEDKDISYKSSKKMKINDDLFFSEDEFAQTFNDNMLIHGDNLLALNL